eukprot:scaffold9141_cov70-Phaeocystis_antarctica.AAC.18
MWSGAILPIRLDDPLVEPVSVWLQLARRRACELSDRARPLLWLPSATAAACAGPAVKARSIGKNCGGTAPKRTRWRVVESELGLNESSLAPSSPIGPGP